MKKLYISCLLCLSIAFVNAQESGIEKFFQRYEQDKSFITISISPKMFTMLSKIDDQQSEEAKQIIEVAKKLKGLKIILKENTADGSKLLQEAKALLPKDYEEMMTIREKDNNIKFIVKENTNGNILELIMLLGGDKKFVAISLLGDINIAEIQRIAKDMKINEFNKFEKIDRKNP